MIRVDALIQFPFESLETRAAETLTVHGNHHTEFAVHLSTAISLKRIADALERAVVCGSSIGESVKAIEKEFT